MASDWYPHRLSEIDSLHTTFSAQCAATGATHGLTAGQIAQAALDSTMVSNLVDYDDAVRGYIEAWTQYRDNMLFGDKTAPLPTPPTNPAFVVGPGAFLPGIRDRTRDFANIIKASPLYTQAVGEDYGIVAPIGAGPSTPAIKVSALAGTSQVQLRISKGGYAAVAIDMQRGGGVWSEVQRVLTASYVDATPPTVPGQPEQRNYRAQGVVGDVRSGDLSPTVPVVTVP